MKDTLSFDIVIIGAGLSGIASALSILKNCDANLAILEARHIGSNNPTPLTFMDVIEQFGLEDHIKARYNKFTMITTTNAMSTHQFDGYPLVALNYCTACQELLLLCQQHGNIALIITEAQKLSRVDDSIWKIETKNGEQIYTPLILDASGRGSFSAHILDLPKAKIYSHSYGKIFSGYVSTNLAEAFYLTPSKQYGSGGGWFYPLKDGLASFGVAQLSESENLESKLIKEKFQRALQEFHPFSSWLEDCRVQSVEQGTIPIFPPKKFVLDGLLRVGDAAAQATIWDCMGCEMALISGSLAGQVAVKAYREKKYSRNILMDYQKEWDQRYRAIYTQASLLSPLVWNCNNEAWERNLVGLRQLNAEQMLARLRINWPQLPLRKIYFILGYDYVGRIRRKMTKKIRKVIIEK